MHQLFQFQKIEDLIFWIAGVFLAVGMLLPLLNGLTAKWAHPKLVRPATENA